MPYVRLANGITAHVKMARTPTKRCQCGKRASLLCDFIVGADGKKTCDAPICSDCTTSPAPGVDHCWRHAKVQPVPTQGTLAL